MVKILMYHFELICEVSKLSRLFSRSIPIEIDHVELKIKKDMLNSTRFDVGNGKYYFEVLICPKSALQWKILFWNRTIFRIFNINLCKFSGCKFLVNNNSRKGNLPHGSPKCKKFSLHFSNNWYLFQVLISPKRIVQ